TASTASPTARSTPPTSSPTSPELPTHRWLAWRGDGPADRATDGAVGGRWLAWRGGGTADRATDGAVGGRWLAWRGGGTADRATGGRVEEVEPAQAVRRVSARAAPTKASWAGVWRLQNRSSWQP